jgi:hypothetical protein
MEKCIQSQKEPFRQHADYDWINKKVNGHSSVYGYKQPRGLAVIYGIYGKTRAQIFWYNVILLFKYVKRKVSRYLHIL